jgi:hypothetical protein
MGALLPGNGTVNRTTGREFELRVELSSATQSRVFKGDAGGESAFPLSGYSFISSTPCNVWAAVESSSAFARTNAIFGYSSHTCRR